MASHLIHRQLIEANFQSKESALSGQKLLQKRYQEVLIPVMQQLFDEYDPVGRHLRIDKLELDLRRFPLDLPENLMRDRLRDVLENQLRKIYLEKGILSPPTSKLPGNRDRISTSKSHSDWEKITYYLIHGRLPWWVTTKEKEPIQSLFDQVADANNSLLKSWLQETPISLSIAKRLAELLNEKQLESMLISGLMISKKEIQLVTNFLELLLFKSNLRKSEIHFWLNSALLFSIFGRENGFTSFIKSGFSAIKSADKKKADETAQFLCFLSFYLLEISRGKSLSKAKDLRFETMPLIKRNAISVSKTEKSHLSANQFWKEVVENLGSVTLDDQELSTLKKELVQQEIQEKNAVHSKSPELDELEVVHNAGLVLVAAFLPRFFENLGLVKSKEFISEQAQIKAVVLLQEMLGSEQAYDETDLLLNKLLCGMPPAGALGLIPKITSSERKEIASLLDSMAIQWTALKSTSGKMIAEGFFRREGSLRKVQKGYQLQIQRLPFDLLLDSLPWTIGMIKLPWMDELISVEW